MLMPHVFIGLLAVLLHRTDALGVGASTDFLDQTATTRRRKTSGLTAAELTDNCECQEIQKTDLSTTKPNVWIFGDSISSKDMGYFDYVKQLLSDVAEVHFGSGGVDSGANGPCGTSFGVTKCLSGWLGGSDTMGKFDVISFNWGLHDIAPSMYATVTDDQYVDKLKEMYKLMKQHLVSGGRLVFQLTTPVPPSSSTRDNADVVHLNGLSSNLLSGYSDVDVNDLYSAMVLACHAFASNSGYPDSTSCEQLQQRDDVHYLAPGNQFLGQVVALSIQRALAKVGNHHESAM